jgi:hypothetical protein
MRAATRWRRIVSSVVPIEVTAKLKRIEPLVKISDRATVRLEETRLLVTHALSLNVERAGIYSLDLTPQPGFVVSEVRGDGVEDWKVTDTTLHVTFTNRVLGVRALNVQLEQALKQFRATSPLRRLSLWVRPTSGFKSAQRRPAAFA